MKMLLLASAAVAFVASSPAGATAYRLDVTGTVGFLDEYNTSASYRTGDPFSASITFETDTFAPPYPGYDGSYALYYGAVTNLSYSIGSYSAAVDRTGASLELSDNFALRDTLTLTSYRNTLSSPTDINGNAQERIILGLEDPSERFLRGVSLGQSFAPAFDVSKLFFARVEHVNDTGSAGVAANIRVTSGSISTVSAIPEPSTWALMMIGMGAMGYSLRRRRAKLTMA